MKVSLAPRALTLSLASFAVTLTCRAAHAEPPDESAMRLPVPESERPITLPRLVASAAVGFTFERYPGDLGYADLDVSGRFGITDDLSVHALVAPLQLSSPPGRGHFEYGQSVGNQGPGLGATYRFLSGPVEIGADLTGYVFTIPGLAGGSLTPSLPIRFHTTWALRLDVDPDVVFVAETGSNAVRLHVPVTLRANVTRSFDVGMTTGVSSYDLSNASRDTGVPLGFLLGYAIPGSAGPVADIDPFFTFPYLVLPGRASPMNSGQWEVGFTVTGFLYL
jgi:hypothetical protein